MKKIYYTIHKHIKTGMVILILKNRLQDKTSILAETKDI